MKGREIAIIDLRTQEEHVGHHSMCLHKEADTQNLIFETIHKAPSPHSTNILWIVDVPGLHKQLETSIKTSLAAIIMYHRN